MGTVNRLGAEKRIMDTWNALIAKNLSPEVVEDLKTILDRKIQQVEWIKRDIEYIQGIIDKYESTKVQIHPIKESPAIGQRRRLSDEWP